jgi:hypothetical protein
MTRQTCTICKERKSIVLFPKDSRYSSGYLKQCKACRNSHNRRKVQCPNCDGTYTNADLAKHMKTKKCINGEEEWKHPMKKRNRFKSNGRNIVICPCKHDQCKVNILEKIAYRHMRYGLRGKFSNEIEWKHPMKTNKRFKSNGQGYVKCPCKHEQCQGKVKECTAYRHMKYGIGYKFPSELKRIEDEKKQFAMLFRDSDDSDSERDL